MQYICSHNEPIESLIQTIINSCDKLAANENLDVIGFGRNEDLVLRIYKDEDFDASKNEYFANFVVITTIQNGTPVDDTEDVYVTDGELERELTRIYNYKDFSTL